MKTYELIIFHKELLERVSAAGIRLDDARYAGLYAEYAAMRQEGGKVSYIVALLAGKYRVSERKVYNIIKKMETDVTPFNKPGGGVK